MNYSIYYQYLLLLKDNGYFRDLERVGLPDHLYSGEKIKYFMANTEQIVFEVTDACNLNCKYCGYGDLYLDYDKRVGKNLSVKTARTLFDYVFELKESPLNDRYSKKIGVGFYGGEPLLNIDFVKEMVDYVKKKKLPHNEFIFMMTTNGVLLDRHMDFLAKNDFLLSISLDGDRFSNSYRVFHNGEPSFETVFNNILKLKADYPEYFRRRINIMSVLHNRNAYKDILSFMDSHFSKTPRLLLLSTIGVRPEKKDDLCKIRKHLNGFAPKDIREFKKNKKKISSLPGKVEIENLLSEFSGFVYTKYDQLIYNNKDQFIDFTGTCQPFHLKTYITVNGKLLPCEKVTHKFSLGSVGDTGVSIDFEEIAAKYNNLYSKVGRLCKSCHQSHYCEQCILQLNFMDAEMECSEYKDFRQYKAAVSKKLSALETIPQLYREILRDRH